MEVDPSILDEKEVNVPIHTVQLDALVALKIIKHCRECLPELANGQLLGLDIDGVLEITFCYPSLNNNEEDGEVDVDYDIEMTKLLRDVNIDSNPVGWYQAAFLASLMSDALIETQYNEQTLNPKSIVCSFDPMGSTQGTLSLRAFRLSPIFMSLYKQNSFTQESILRAGLSFTEVFEELPVKIRNSPLDTAVTQFLNSGSKSLDTPSGSLARLQFNTSPFLEKNMELLIDYIDELSTEQGKYQYYQRCVQRQSALQQQWLQKRKQENALRRASGEKELPEEEDASVNQFKVPAQPSRLESLLITGQINNFCKQLNNFSAPSFSKLFLFAGLEEDLTE